MLRSDEILNRSFLTSKSTRTVIPGSQMNIRSSQFSLRMHKRVHVRIILWNYWGYLLSPKLTCYFLSCIEKNFWKPRITSFRELLHPHHLSQSELVRTNEGCVVHLNILPMATGVTMFFFPQWAVFFLKCELIQLYIDMQH